MRTHTVAWKHADGHGGQCNVGEYESAFACMLAVAGEAPEARVWFDGGLIQRGFVADEGRGQQ